MKAFVIREPNKAELMEVDIPKVPAGEVLIKVSASGFCGTDIHTFKGEYPSDYPVIPGHEFSGVIAELGEGVTRFKRGEAVVADPNIFCESCYFCQQNQQIYCENLDVIGNFRPGAFAEYVTAPERCVFNAEGIDPVQASMAEPLACVVYGHNKAAIRIGGDVLIFGAGTIGLMHLMLAKRRGAARVVMADIKPAQLEIAKKLGADEIVLSDATVTEKLRKLAPRGYSMIIDATGVPAVVQNAIPLLINNGVFMAFGVCPTDSSITINPFDLYHKEWQLIGSCALQKTMPQSIAMLREGRMDLAPLVGAVITIDEMPQWFADFVAGKTNNKIIVKF